MSDEAIKDLEASIHHILDTFDPQAMARTEDLGKQMDFSEHVGLFKRVLDLFKRLRNSDLHPATDQQIHDLKAVTDEVANALQNIVDFQVTTSSNPRSTRQQYIDNVTNSYERAKQFAGPVIALSFAWRGGIDLDRAQGEVRDALERIDAEGRDAMAKLDAKLEQANKAVSAIRDRAGEVGVAEHARVFEKAAEEFAGEKKRWLRIVKYLYGGGAILAVANLGIVLVLILSDASIETEDVVQLAVAKLLLFSFAYYIVVWASRIHRAASHNEIVNHHRALALKTFDKFVAAAGDESTKQAVLLRTTESIFGHRPSGFSESAPDSSGVARLLEIVRGVPEPPSAGGSN